MDTMVALSHPHTINSNTKGDGCMAESRSPYMTAYKKEHYKRVPFEISKDYYTDVLFPAAQRKGMSVNSFIKEAIAEKVERESK